MSDDLWDSCSGPDITPVCDAASAVPERHAHSHGVRPGANVRWLWLGLGLLTAYLVAEVVVALLSRSLALLSDAGHLLTDVGSLAVALWAIRLAARPARGAMTYGWKRAEILSAAGNAATLLVVGLIVLIEAVRRLVHPPHVDAAPVLITALVGIGVNIVVAWAVARADRSSLNVEGAYQHILTDLFGFLATAAAAVVILATGWQRADAVASLVLVVLMFRSGLTLARQSSRILLEAAPPGVRISDIREHLLRVDHVRDVHDLHVWTVTSDDHALSAHVVVDEGCFADSHAPQLLDALQACLHEHFDIGHSSLQLEPPTHAAHETAIH
ncbi:cation diffusion facilitator family transporter [Allobranchiibius sp. GilTou38]|uniref:cation diffusion facilitator family transporter n=1 Tax=Allobranchiibius sp. GilTou38 TaxID=2815210 RepID=UPI001AA18F46|nr:cation diffusion facilitator family transporter [Allobranchiibius sp. GilTou38]MBO1765501.1 cation transporter [Allobranchiibius sp. GilTou38]